MSAFVAALTPISVFAADYSAETLPKGNVVYVPRVDSVATTTFSHSDNSGFPYEQTGSVVNTITVTLNENHLAPLDLTGQQFANSSAAKFANFAQVQGQTLGKLMLQRIWSLLTTVNFGLSVVGISIAQFSRASFNFRAAPRSQYDQCDQLHAPLAVGVSVVHSTCGPRSETRMDRWRILGPSKRLCRRVQ